MQGLQSGEAAAKEYRWVRVPASLVLASDAETVFGVLNSRSVADAVQKTRQWKETLGLSSEEHEKLAAALHRMIQDWAMVQSVEPQTKNGGPDENWLLTANPTQMRAVEDRFQADIRASVGPERAGLFNALVHRDLQRIFSGAGMIASFNTKGNFSISNNASTGAYTWFFGDETLGAAGVITTAVDRWMRQHPQPPAN